MAALQQWRRCPSPIEDHANDSILRERSPGVHIRRGGRRAVLKTQTFAGDVPGGKSKATHARLWTRAKRYEERLASLFRQPFLVFCSLLFFTNQGQTTREREPEWLAGLYHFGRDRTPRGRPLEAFCAPVLESHCDVQRGPGSRRPG